MCGAVRFVARDVQDKAGICHCEICRRWTGSAMLADGGLVPHLERKLAATAAKEGSR